MSQHIRRSITEPIRDNLSWDERWNGPDNGLIISWEVGRQQGERDPDLGERAKNGELPPLDWKGGVEKKLKSKFKYGCLNYLAAWQGLREEDLDIDLERDVEIVCSRTGSKVIFTPDQSKYSTP
jgi:hypothetical protein